MRCVSSPQKLASWRAGEHSRSHTLILASRQTFIAAAWKMTQPSSLLVLDRPGGEPPPPLGGKKGAAGSFLAVERRESSVGQVVSKSSRTWARRAGSARGTGPSAPPGSTAVLGCFSHQPVAVICHPRRGKPAQAGRGGPPEALHTRHWPAVMTPRRVALRADDAAAPHRAAGGTAPSIEGARTYAGGTTRGAAGRFPRVRSESTGGKLIDLAH